MRLFRPRHPKLKEGHKLCPLGRLGCLGDLKPGLKALPHRNRDPFVTWSHSNLGRIQVDELWGFVKKKQRFVRADEDESRVGDVWTFVAIDAESKLVPAFRLGKRDRATAWAFMKDVASRVEGRVQISADSLPAYIDAVTVAFGGRADFGQIVKSYEAESIGPGRYSPPNVVSVARRVVRGNPNPEHISTSYIERLNLTTRMQVRRLTRLTNAFSKKPENLRAAIALHFAHYNFVRRHRTLTTARKGLHTTPAMAAGVTDRPSGP